MINVKYRVFLFVVCSVLAASYSYSEHSIENNASIYTICQRELCLEVEVEAKSLAKSMAHTVDHFSTVSTNELLVAYDALMKYLIDNLDLRQSKEDSYYYDHLVFSFYEYYLQVIPFVESNKRYLYINAYRRGWDKYDRNDESPSKKFVSTFGGGANYWRVVYDIEKGIFIGLHINGIS